LFVFVIPILQFVVSGLRKLHDGSSELALSRQSLVHPLYLEWTLFCRLVKILVVPVLAASVSTPGQTALVLMLPCALDLVTMMSTWVAVSLSSVETLRWVISLIAGSQLVMSTATVVIVAWRDDMMTRRDAVVCWWAIYALSVVVPAFVAWWGNHCVGCTASDRDGYQDSDVFDGPIDGEL
jgi:hypothetical protein